MDRKTYNWAKRTGREAYEQAIRDMDAVGEGGQPIIDQHRHPDYALIDHPHIDLSAQIEHNEDRINALEHELDAIADTKETGEWELVSILDFDIRGSGQMTLFFDDFGISSNEMTLHETDKNGLSHGFSGVEQGDLVEIVEEHPTRSTGDYGLYKVKSVNGMTFALELQQGRGTADTNKNFFIKFFHLSEDVNIAELDARYALKEHTHTSLPSHTHDYAPVSHTHSTAAHEHNYQQISLRHQQKAYYGSNINWDNPMYFFPYERRGSSGSLYQNGRIENMGKLVIKQSNLYAQVGKSGTLIGTTGESSANHGTFIVMNVWDSTYQSYHSQQGNRIQTIYGTTIWVQDSAKGRNWEQADALWWWYRGAGR